MKKFYEIFGTALLSTVTVMGVIGLLIAAIIFVLQTFGLAGYIVFASVVIFAVIFAGMWNDYEK